jgi:hypothetical protein
MEQGNSASAGRRQRLLAASAAGSCALLLLAGAEVAAIDEQVPSVDPKVRGYVLTNIYVAAPDQPGACPKSSLSSAEIFAASLTPQEREKYKDEGFRRLMAARLGFKMVPTGLRTDSGQDIEDLTAEQLAAARAKAGVAPGKGAPSFLGTRLAYDSCTNPEDFPQFAVGNQTYLGKISEGLNLDGKAGATDFVSPEGEKGVDNQLLRATGCNFGSRDFGDPKVADKAITSAPAPTLVELHGVDSLKDDNEVRVEIYAAAEPLRINAAGGALAWTSFDADSDPRWRASVKARIVDGVLLTDKLDLRLRQKEQIIDSFRDMRGARLRMTFNPDGTVAGGVYGYHTLASIAAIYAQSTQIGADLAKYSCPGLLGAIRKAADGYPDPRSGRNTAISATLRFVGAPAFVIHKPDTRRVAARPASVQEARR